MLIFNLSPVNCRGGGPGGCDTSHWKDILLQFGGSSAKVRDTAAAVCR